ncbi:MAG: peptidoglycan-binding protein, partial [Patescibacteria group bacterium]
MSKLTYKIATASIAIMTVASLSAPAFAQVSVADLLAQIQALQAQLMQLQGTSSTTTGSTSSYTFTKNLTIGSTGDDVKQLQSILIAGGYLKIATPTTWFGPMTKAALIEWQKANGVSPTSGYFGPLSRAKINSTGSTGGSTGGVVTATESYLKVEAVPSLGGNIPSSSLYNKVLNLKLTAGKDAVVVTGITATRGGYIANTRINGVSVWDEAGKRYGNIVTSLTSDGKVTVNFGSDPMTVPAGTTKTLSVAINLDSTTTSASLNFGVMSASDVKVSGTAPVMGTFPMVGGTYTVVDGSASLGDAQVDDQSVSGMSSSSASNSSVSGNLEIGETQREVYKLKVTQNNSKEAIQVKNVSFYVSGNIVETTDLKNWKLYSQEGNLLATTESSKDRFVTFNLATPYTIDKGLSRTFSVKVDVMDGSGRYFNLSIQNDYDIVATGVTTGASVLLTDSSGNTLEQADTKDDTAGWFKMKQGQLTVSKSSASPSGSIAPAASNTVLGEFEIKSSGEQLEIRKMKVIAVRSGLAPVLTGSLTVKNAATGETYLSVSADTTGVQGTSTAAAVQQTLSSYLPLSSNQTVKLQVLGSVSSNATSGSYQVSIGNFYGKRFSTNDFVDLTGASTYVQANSLSLKDVTLTATKDASFANTNRAQGAQAVKIGQFNLQASAADDIQVNSITLSVATSGNISNLMIKVGDTQLGSTIGTPSATGNNFTISNFKVEKGTTKTVSVFADIQSNAAGSSYVTITNVGGYGVASGKALESVSSGAGQTIAIGTPSVTIASSDNSAITSKVLLAGTTGVSLGDIKFTALNEDLSLRKITINLAAASSGLWSSIDQNFSAVKLFDGTNELGSTNSVINGAAVITLGSDKWVTLPQGSDKILTIKADISANTAILPQSVFRATVTSSSTDDLEINSASLGLMDTGVTISSVATNYYKVQATVPTVVAGSGFSANTVGAADSEIGRVTVGKQGDRNVILTGLTLRVQLTGGSASSSITTFTLKDADSGATVATTAQTLTGASVSTSTVFTFASTTISTSKTYKLYADTSGIRTGVASTDHPNVLVDFVMPSAGYTADADFWTDANVTYGYDIYNPTLSTYASLKNMNKNSDNA